MCMYFNLQEKTLFVCFTTIRAVGIKKGRGGNLPTISCQEYKQKFPFKGLDLLLAPAYLQTFLRPWQQSVHASVPPLRCVSRKNFSKNNNLAAKTPQNV